LTTGGRTAILPPGRAGPDGFGLDLSGNKVIFKSANRRFKMEKQQYCYIFVRYKSIFTEPFPLVFFHHKKQKHRPAVFFQEEKDE
jgi:hypothetical protein